MEDRGLGGGADWDTPLTTSWCHRPARVHQDDLPDRLRSREASLTEGRGLDAGGCRARGPSAVLTRGIQEAHVGSSTDTRRHKAGPPVASHTGPVHSPGPPEPQGPHCKTGTAHPGRPAHGRCEGRATRPASTVEPVAFTLTRHSGGDCGRRPLLSTSQSHGRSPGAREPASPEAACSRDWNSARGRGYVVSMPPACSSTDQVSAPSPPRSQHAGRHELRGGSVGAARVGPPLRPWDCSSTRRQEPHKRASNSKSTTTLTF